MPGPGRAGVHKRDTPAPGGTAWGHSEKYLFSFGEKYIRHSRNKYRCVPGTRPG